jgi:hypothetical protein
MPVAMEDLPLEEHLYQDAYTNPKFKADFQKAEKLLKPRYETEKEV